MENKPLKKGQRRQPNKRARKQAELTKAAAAARTSRRIGLMHYLKRRPGFAQNYNKHGYATQLAKDMLGNDRDCDELHKLRYRDRDGEPHIHARTLQKMIREIKQQTQKNERTKGPK